jgi:hypothetical protein
LLPLTLLTACGPQAARPARSTASVSVEQTIFPSRDTLAKIAAAPAPARLSDETTKDLPTWQLTGPLPDAVDRVSPQDDSAWGKLFSEAVAARGGEVLATEAMRCVARENAAFALANDAQPAEMLSRFIAARCGATTGLGGSALQFITGDERMPDDRLFTQFRDRIRAMMDKTLKQGGGRLEAGFAYLRKGGKAVIGVAVAPQTVRLDRTPLVPGADGKVVLSGELLGSATRLRALVNRGRFAYAECAADPTVQLPRFRISCETSREDEMAWISVSALPPGRVLGSTVLEMLAWPSGAPANAYAKLARGGADSAAGGAESVLAEINLVRREAALKELRLADAESRTAAQVAPHYFGAFDAQRAEIADQVALGLLAGWEVDGMVRHGHFVSTWVNNAASWAEVVRAAISRPQGRETLLDPQAERIAIGPVAAQRAYGALFSTYALFDGYRHDNDARTLGARLAALRSARGLGQPRMATELNAEAGRAAAEVQAGRRTAAEALDLLLHRISESLGRGVRAWAAETTSIEQMKIPDELVGLPAMTFGIGVAHHRQEGQPWGRFVVFIVVLDEGVGGGMTARREGGPSGG